MIPQSSVLEAIRLSNLKDKIAAKKQVSRAKRNVFRSPLHMPQVSVISQDPNVEKDKQIIKNPSCLGECIPEATSLSLNMDQKNVDTEIECSNGNIAMDTQEDIEDGPTSVAGFTILGNISGKIDKNVKHRLPQWLSKPVAIVDGACCKKLKTSHSDASKSIGMTVLSADLKDKLKKNGISFLFPVQESFISFLLADMTGNMGGFHPRDVCVCTPTGSGKTLAYVLPIVQVPFHTHVVVHLCALRVKHTRRLVLLNKKHALYDCFLYVIMVLLDTHGPLCHAVVLLPVGQLAEQVYHVFQQYCAGTHLKVGLAIGKTTFADEQKSLVHRLYDEYERLMWPHGCGPFVGQVDILVTTPGRLVDHIRHTAGFDLSHLRFLVLDEADKLMELETKSEWMSEIERHAYAHVADAYCSSGRRRLPSHKTYCSEVTHLPLQKLLFSATLSHNPEKLEQFHLFWPQLMTCVVSETCGKTTSEMSSRGTSMDTSGPNDATQISEGYIGKFTTPKGLTEYLVECSAEEKPLMTLHFISQLKFTGVLCFTRNVETTHRLCLLARLCGVNTKAISSRLSPQHRRKILLRFSLGKISMLVCSDMMARGMDVENVKCVICYDYPLEVDTYVHRVGRTARGERAGTAITLLEKKEFGYFKRMMKSTGKWSNMKELKINRDAMRPLEGRFCEALERLRHIVQKQHHNNRT